MKNQNRSIAEIKAQIGYEPKQLYNCSNCREAEVGFVVPL